MQPDAHGNHPAGGRWLALMRARRFDILLGALVLLFLSTPVVRVLATAWHPILAMITVSTLFGLMLLSAVFAVSRSRRSVSVALAMAVPGLVLQELGTLVGQDVLLGTGQLFSTAFLGYTIFLILRFLFTGDRVTYNTICASICAYLLIGVLWANVYSFVEMAAPVSFAFPLAEEGGSSVMRFGGRNSVFPIYYSFVTLTTLGYGDIVPLSPAARMFAALEAVMGQLYLAVLVARLVGLHIAQSARKAAPPETEARVDGPDVE